MAQNDPLIAQYARQQVVRDRNTNALLMWAMGTSSIPVQPGNRPSVEEVRNKIVAERVPLQTQQYVDRTMSFFMQSPSVQTNIRQYLNAFNDEGTEVALSGQNADTIASFMPRFAMLEVSNSQVNEWFRMNGFEPEPGPAAVG